MSFDRFEYREKENNLLCKDCGSVIERGIISVSNHWVECGGKQFYKDLMNLAQQKNGKLTIKDINKLNNT